MTLLKQATLSAAPDYGDTWTAANNGLPTNPVVCFAISGDKIFAGSMGGGVYVSSDNGSNWTAANNGLTDRGVYALAVFNGKLLAATHGGIFAAPL